MTSLTDLASKLLDLQKQDHFAPRSYRTEIEDSMRFSAEHGYGDLAIKVRDLWNQLSDNDHKREMFDSNTNKNLSIYEKKQRAYQMRKEGISYSAIADYIGISSTTIYKWRQEFQRRQLY
ncbi:helix-turn-helix domain-containing protein [Oenococcus sp. UCMA 16435]|nr:helix-turn-helix domain-containing protein [Oenococcus sp. UCMA 16435]MDI4584276.1 helix-turn-helix domain-containing protein [Oenococcus sp. UCMA 14587]MDN6967029.1 helix-turn-helix domain-containing protein [Oenococcus sp. UCMA 17063]